MYVSINPKFIYINNYLTFWVRKFNYFVGYSVGYELILKDMEI